MRPLWVTLGLLVVAAVGIPSRYARQAQFLPGPLPQRGALFIPQSQMGSDFDPTKPIPGHFIASEMNGDVQSMSQFVPQPRNTVNLGLANGVVNQQVTSVRLPIQDGPPIPFNPHFQPPTLQRLANQMPPAFAIQQRAGIEPLETTTVSMPLFVEPINNNQLSMNNLFPIAQNGVMTARGFVPLPPATVSNVQEETSQSTVVEQSPLPAAEPEPIAPKVAAPPPEQQEFSTESTTVEATTTGTSSTSPIINPDLPPVDKNVDLNGDGALSLPEVQYAAFVHHGLSGSVVEGLFKQVDGNKDNYLDSQEFNDIRPLVLAKAENAALRYMQSVDSDHNKMLSLPEAQAYMLKEYGIGSRDVERVWKLVVPDTNAGMDASQFSKLRRRIRGMTIRLARQIMKTADTNGDGHISRDEAQAIAFEQEGIGAGDVNQMLLSVDDNGDGELNAPEFADFERIIRARAVDTSRKALKVVDVDGSGTLTMDEARRIAFEHYGFDERVLGPFFAQADENEDGQLDAVEFAGFRSVIRSRAVKDALKILKEIDTDGDDLVARSEAEDKTMREDDMDPAETHALFNIADQNKSGKLDKVELADFIRLVRLSAIKFATDHFKEFDNNRDSVVTLDELVDLIAAKYRVQPDATRVFFDKVDVDQSGDLIPAEIVDFRHEIRRYVAERDAGQLPAEEFFFTTSPSLAPKRKFTTVSTTISTSTSTTTEATTVVEDIVPNEEQEPPQEKNEPEPAHEVMKEELNEDMVEVVTTTMKPEPETTRAPDTVTTSEKEEPEVETTTTEEITTTTEMQTTSTEMESTTVDETKTTAPEHSRSTTVSRKPVIFRNRNKPVDGMDDTDSLEDGTDVEISETGGEKAIKEEEIPAVNEDSVKLIDVSEEEDPVQPTITTEKTQATTKSFRRTTPTRSPYARRVSRTRNNSKTTTVPPVEEENTSVTNEDLGEGTDTIVEETSPRTSTATTTRITTSRKHKSTTRDVPSTTETLTTSTKAPITISLKDEIIEYVEVPDDGTGEQPVEVVEYIEEVIDSENGTTKVTVVEGGKNKEIPAEFDEAMREEKEKMREILDKRSGKTTKKTAEETPSQVNQEAGTDTDLELVEEEYEAEVEPSTTINPSKIRI